MSYQMISYGIISHDMISDQMISYDMEDKSEMIGPRHSKIMPLFGMIGVEK